MTLQMPQYMVLRFKSYRELLNNFCNCCGEVWAVEVPPEAEFLEKFKCDRKGPTSQVSHLRWRAFDMHSPQLSQPAPGPNSQKRGDSDYMMIADWVC